MLAIAGASMAMSAYSMNEQTKATNRQVDAEMANAKTAQIADQNALQEQATQIADKGRDEKLQRQREALRERSRMRVASGDMQGNSVDRLFNTSYFNEEFDTATIDKNVQNGLSQNLREGEKANTLATNRMRSAQSQWVSGSQASSRMLISGVQGGLQGYAMGKSMFGK